MKKFTKILTASALALAAFASVSCNKKAEKKVTIGIVQQMNHNSLNTISDSIKARLAELGYNENNSTVLFKQGDNDMTMLAQISEEYVNQKADIIIAIATKAANAALPAVDSNIPVVFAACADPVGAKLVQNLAEPEGLVTGTSQSIPVDQIMEFAKKIQPQLSKIGIIHTTGETNAQATVNKAIAYLDSIGMAYADHTIDDVSVIQETIKLMKDEGCQAVFVANDNKLASHGNMAILGGACLENGFPLYCAADSQVEDGGFANIGITYSDLGRDTADMTDKILKGTPVSKVPVKFYLKAEDLKIFVNPDVTKALGITLPSDVTSSANYIEVKPTN
ncbi:MAG: ABC transporter substrate-binding protein [Treponema sp.]|nr:ABC transporter substrate-binding protein [Candidatus Treponema equifaecale]